MSTVSIPGRFKLGDRVLHMPTGHSGTVAGRTYTCPMQYDVRVDNSRELLRDLPEATLSPLAKVT